MSDEAEAEVETLAGGEHHLRLRIRKASALSSSRCAYEYLFLQGKTTAKL